MKIRKVIFFLIVIVLICSNQKVYGRHVTNLDINIQMPWATVWTSAVSLTDREMNDIFTSANQNKKIIENLKDKFGYESSETTLKEKMKLDTTIKIVEEPKRPFIIFGEKKYKIQIGDEVEGYKTTKEVNQNDLQEIYGCPDINKINTPWNVLLIVNCKPEKRNRIRSGIICTIYIYNK